MPPALPLTGLRVLTFENFGAGPFGSMYLADLGAEVIKIENRDQGGDATRAMGPFFLGEHDSQFFQAFNLNKKSVTLNLKHAAGREAFHRLVRTADVVLNNLRGDQPEKLGLDYAAWARSIRACSARTCRPTGVTTSARAGPVTTT
jgi:crotonobetainyl-CoA:carnitine CoA-transferase CaiB-like acyl-CoA transferase